MQFKSLVSALPVCLMLASQSGASVLSADFSETLDLPSLGGGARVFLHQNVALGVGAELNIDHEVANPSGWNGYVDIDLSASGLLTFSRDIFEQASSGDYDYALITISNIIFDSMQSISGVSIVSEDLLDTSYPFSGSPQIRFSTNSISFLFDHTSGGDDSDFRFKVGGVSTYQISTQTVAPVPLPATLPLLAAALSGVALVRRRRKTS